MALWGIPLILFLSFQGSLYFFVLILVINGFALREFYKLVENLHFHSYKIFGITLSYLILIAAFWLSQHLLYAVFLVVSAILLWRNLKISEPSATANTAVTLLGLCYIPLFLSSSLILRENFDIWIRNTSEQNIGGIFFIFLWISIWVCDTFAYFGGRLFGKHKLAPQTSPNKTIEGAIFGIIGAFIIFVGIAPHFLNQLTFTHFTISALIIGIFGQIGDLVESRLKRDASLKDTSSLLPGHGGFLDRFDSFIYVSPFFFLLFYFNRF
jgi:phosphatidate cytidylyltransferase